jgi:predicted secreted hydrolase
MLRSRSLVVGIVLLVGALGLGAYWLTAGSAEEGFQTSVSVAEAMSSDTSGYRRATEVRNFTFPEDHGPHPGFKNEWWYVTGNLQDDAGRPYGYELTIFRFALTPPDSTTGTSLVSSDATGWRTNQFYMAHFALTNGADETFHAYERFGRGGAGIAGASADPFRVWLEDWSMTSVGAEPFPVRLRAQGREGGIDLTIRPEKPMVFQGDQGLSQKGPGVGNASYYYSYTRLATEGTLVAGGDTVQVSGQSWLDREWSTSALGPDQVGWDWFSLQLNDGQDLMYYQLRNKDGSPSRFSEGTLVAPDGGTTKIGREDVSVEVLETWTSPDGTHTYPVEWTLRVPAENLTLHVVPLMPNQELDVSVRYWEGAVRVEAPDGTLMGRGYVELTGYGDSPASPTS